jgi:hypothetical protein
MKEGVRHSITLADSTTYTFSFYGKLDTGTFNTLIAGYSEVGTAIGQDDCTLNSQTMVTTGWTYYQCTFTTPASHSGTPYIYIEQSDAVTGQIFYVDAVQLTQASTIGAYYEGKIDASALAFQNQLTVHTSDNDTTTAFRVLNSTNMPVFTVDTLNGYVYIGNPVADATGALLVLDTKNTSGDPAGINGATYYNSNVGKFRCYENGAWKNCSGFSQNIALFGQNGAGSSTWTDMPAGLTEFLVGTSGVVNAANRVLYDLTDATQVRLQVNVEAAGSTNAELRLQYSTDQVSWNYISGVSGLGQNISSTGLKVSSWSTIAAGAKGDVYLRLVGINGDASADPDFGAIQLQVR